MRDTSRPMGLLRLKLWDDLGAALGSGWCIASPGNGGSPGSLVLNTVRNPWRGVDAGGREGLLLPQQLTFTGIAYFSRNSLLSPAQLTSPATAYSHRHAATAPPPRHFMLRKRRRHAISFHFISFYVMLFHSIPFFSIPFHSILFFSIPF